MSLQSDFSAGNAQLPFPTALEVERLQRYGLLARRGLHAEPSQIARAHPERAGLFVGEHAQRDHRIVRTRPDPLLRGRRPGRYPENATLIKTASIDLPSDVAVRLSG